MIKCPLLDACLYLGERGESGSAGSHIFMSSLCGVGVRVRVNNFSSKTTRPRDVLFFLKDTLSIEDEKLFKACKSVCSSVC